MATAPLEPSTAELIAELARQAQSPRVLADRVVVTHYGEVVADETLESGKEHPERARGTVSTTHPTSLVTYAKPLLTPSARLYVIPDEMAMAVVLNDDTPLAAGWRDHVATMRLTPTPGWVRWRGANRKLLSQVEFAELIEDGLGEIVDPDGADLLELAQTFHATSSAAFRGGQRLKDGAVSFTYTEDVSAVGGAQGQLAIPDRITLSLTPFYGADPRRVSARFRFRLNGGKLALGFIVDGLEEMLRGVVDQVAADVAAALELQPICVSALPQPTKPRH